MTYRINSYIEEQNRFRFHAAECYYIEQLESRGGLIRLDNVAVDAEQLAGRCFQCDTPWCLRHGGPDGKWSGSCCTDLEVNLTPDEIERLRKLGKAGLKKLEWPARDSLGAAARRMAAGEFIDRTEAGDAALMHQKSGCCTLGWITRGGELRCAINALCQRMNLPLEDYKPDPCLLFPLHALEYLPGQFFVTIICEETHQAMGADRYVARLRCLRRPVPGAAPAYVSLRNELVHCFGEEFYQSLGKAAEEWNRP